MGFKSDDWDTISTQPNASQPYDDEEEKPFSKRSPLCLDGKITDRSQHLVVSGSTADIWTGLLHGRRTIAIKISRRFNSMGIVIDKSQLLKRLWREYLARHDLTHPNILDFLGYSYDFTPESENSVPSLISPWMPNGTIVAYLADDPPGVNRIELITGVAKGLSYLHNRGPAIIHGNIRGGNVLISANGTPRLTDFGLSRVLDDVTGTTTSEVSGSLRWMAPEIFHNEKSSTCSDVWAFGMTILEILSGQRPYAEIGSDPAVMYQILGQELPSRPSHDNFSLILTDGIWSICLQCWKFRAVDRCSMGQVTWRLEQFLNPHLPASQAADEESRGSTAEQKLVRSMVLGWLEGRRVEESLA